MKILISACLLGEPCRYDAKKVPCDAAINLKEKHELFLVCPECAGGLKTPRIPCERVGDKVLTKDKKDVTKEYKKGAECALKIAKENGITIAVLKERSPSCGCGKIYDGTFSKTLKSGDGVTAELLKANEITVLGESEIDKYL